MNGCHIIPPWSMENRNWSRLTDTALWIFSWNLDSSLDQFVVVLLVHSRISKKWGSDQFIGRTRAQGHGTGESTAADTAYEAVAGCEISAGLDGLTRVGDGLRYVYVACVHLIFCSHQGCPEAAAPCGGVSGTVRGVLQGHGLVSRHGGTGTFPWPKKEREIRSL